MERTEVLDMMGTLKLYGMIATSQRGAGRRRRVSFIVLISLCPYKAMLFWRSS
jgi:hypothetical protein